MSNFNKKQIIFIFLILILLSVICLIYSIFKKIENEFLFKQSKVLQNIVYDNLNKQLKTTIDWAYWDDTVDFVENGNRNFINSNIDDGTLKNIGIDFMLFFNKNRELYYAYFLGRGDKLNNEYEVFTLKLETKYYNFLSTEKKLNIIKTFAKIDNKIYMLTFAPILENNRKKPAYGTLVFGKNITNNFFKKFEMLFNIKINLIKNFYIPKKRISIKNKAVFIPFSDANNNIIFILKVFFKKMHFITTIKLLILGVIFFIILIIFIFMKISSISEQKKIRSELEMLYHAIEQSETGIILTKFDGTIFYVNNIVCKVTGFTKKELYGQLSTKLLDENVLHEIFTGALKEKGFWKGEIFGKIKDGGKIDLEINISPVYSSNKRISCFITTCEFISDKKKMIDELKRAKQEAEEYNKMKSSVLLNLSHEIKTPLTGIIGFIELLESTGLSKTQKEYLQYLKESSNRLMNLLNNFIELAKFEANLYSIKLELFSLYSFNRILTEKFKALANKKNLIFKYTIDRSIPDKVSGSEEILNKAISLIMDNAIKFTESGEILYECKLLEKDKNRVKICFTIQDTGIGIKKEHLSKIFNSFSQIDISPTRKFEGMGIGLSLAKRYIDAINGKIYVFSKEGKGTEFKIVVEFELGIGKKVK